MEVVCISCVWWLKKDNLEGFGDCTKLDHDSIDVSKSIFAVINKGLETNIVKDVSFITAEKFGCVLGKAITG